MGSHRRFRDLPESYGSATTTLLIQLLATTREEHASTPPHPTWVPIAILVGHILYPGNCK